MSHEWVLGYFLPQPERVAEPDHSPLDYVTHTLAEQDKQAEHSTEHGHDHRIRLMEQADQHLATIAYRLDEVALFPDERVEVNRLGEQRVWRQPQHRRQYPRGQGVRAKRRKFGCPVWTPSHQACYPGILASLYDDLPWTPGGYMVTLTAPPGQFQSCWTHWQGLEAWDRTTARRRLEHQIFYLYVFAWSPGARVDHPVEDGASMILRDLRQVHVHLLVGNISQDLLYQEVRQWPGVWNVERLGVGARTVWGGLHYVLGGQANETETEDNPLPRQHAADVYSRQHALCDVPRYSANFEMLLTLTNWRIERTLRAQAVAAGKQSGANQTADWRRARGQKGAAEKWRRYYAKQTGKQTEVECSPKFCSPGGA